MNDEMQDQTLTNASHAVEGQNPVVQESLHVGERALADALQAAGSAKRGRGRPPRLSNVGGVGAVPVGTDQGGLPGPGGVSVGAGLTVDAVKAVLRTADRLNQSLLRKFGKTALGDDIERLAAEVALEDGQAETIAEPLLQVAAKYGWDLSFGPEVALAFAALPWVMPNLLLWREVSARLRGPVRPAAIKPEAGGEGGAA
jgi:hypothetical protein